MWLLSIILALGSGIAGAVVTPFLTQSRDRRAARAAVRENLYPARYAWMPPSFDAWNEGWPNYKMEETIYGVETLAMIANVPRRLMARYGDAHRAAYKAAVEHPEGGWDTSEECQGELRAATEELVGYLWHPGRYYLRRSWLNLRRWLHQLQMWVIKGRGAGLPGAGDATAPRGS